MPESLTSVRRLEAQELAAEAYTLRLSGASYPAIATALGYNSRQAAFIAVGGHLKRIHRESAAKERHIDLERLDALILAVFERAVGGDFDAIELMLRLMARRARMLGYDEPTKVNMVMVHAEAKRLADMLGLDAERLVAEAERIVREAAGV